MKKLIVVLIVFPFAVWIAQATDHKSAGESNLTTNGDASSHDCADRLHMYNDDFRSYVRDEESQRVPNQPLTITAEHNGGVEVSTWEQPEISIKLGTNVGANDEAEDSDLPGEVQ